MFGEIKYDNSHTYLKLVLTFSTYNVICLCLQILFGIVSVCGNAMCLSKISLSGVQGSEENLFGLLVSQLTLSEIMVQGKKHSEHTAEHY